MPVSIVIAHPTDLMLLGMQSVFSQHAEFQVHAALSSLKTLISAVRILQPDVVIFDEHLDPELDVLTILPQLRTKSPHIRPIIFGSVRNGLFIRDLFDCGVKAYLYEGDDLQEALISSVETVMRDHPYLSPTANAEYLIAMQSPLRDWRLDTEARLILRLLAQGCHVGQIAYEMKLPVRRVYWVREKLRRRFGATTNEHLISRAAAEGFTYPG